ncbi:MAG: hypothetical protein QOF76_3372, partial [Solirubrobacteraceae bacterium]|nr:hypothetical protein [Solirubrobacteraceae bacterium]
MAAELHAGNEAALETTHDRYAPELLRVCERILGSREEAEDALQATFADAWRAVNGEGGVAPQNLRAWLHAIARNRCLSTLRARPPRMSELTHDLPAGVLPIDEIARRQAVRAIVADLQELPAP